jgi:DMSO reductase family type II enzyme chaperone
MYSLLARGFRFPSPAYYERVKKGQFADEAKKAIANLPYEALKGSKLEPVAASTYEEFQSHYIALFEVGGDFGPPCPLYEGEFGGGRMKVMEEVLRFYHHFGLRLSTVKRDRPDHLALELEFMHALTFKEAEALSRNQERKAYVQAQRDFLRFHLHDFVAAVAARAGGKDVPFYSDLARLAESFCRHEAAYLLAASPGE